MTKTRADMIRYLMGRKFPFWKSIAAGQSVRSGSVAMQAANDMRAEVSAYESELQSMPDAMLRELNDSEMEKQRQQARIKADQEEKARFFNLPSAAADYGYWAKAAYWSLDEAVALALGKNPEKVNPATLAPYQNLSAFPQKFERLKNLAFRAKNVGKLYDPVFPSIFLNWAMESEIELPQELREAVSKVAQLQSWQEISKKQAEVIEKLQEVIARQSAELEHFKGGTGSPVVTSSNSSLQPAETTKSQSPVERDNMLKVILAIAMDAYGHDPEAKRSTATNDIQTALHTAGLNLSDDTIRRFIKQAEERLDEWRADDA